jgi:membrane-associated phospholipid phosphatase
LRRSTYRRLALAAAAMGAATPLLRRQKIPRPLVSAIAWQTPLAVRLAFPPSKLREAAVYGAQMWAYVNHYEMPNDDPEALLARVRVKYPIAVDRLIGAGEIPNVRLQRALGRPGEVLPHDTFLAWIHWAWFFFPHGTVAWMLVRHPERFERAGTMMAATFDAGCIAYWLLPTAPPWWARRDSRNGRVRRLMVEAGERFWGRVWEPLYDSLGGNPFAAMPSLHFATSVTAAHLLSDTGRVPGILAWTYTATLGFALVYLGEHYVVDLIAGLALAEGVRRSEPAVTPALRAFKDAIQRLELRGT